MRLSERDEVRAQRRRRSKTLFGNADRLDVAYAVAVAPGGLVHAQELADRLGISPPRVRAQLLAFTEAGVMRQLPRTGATQDYQRIDGAFWDATREIVEGWG